MVSQYTHILLSICLTFGVSFISAAQFTSTLPIIKISTPGGQEIMDDPKITAHMGIINNGEGNSNSSVQSFNDYDGVIGIEFRGASSLNFDKKGYGLETRNADGSNNNVPLLGMPKENDWILNGPYPDKTLLRNVLSYHIGSLTGRYVPRTRLCELIIDNEYQGVYVLTEKIKQDKNRVDISKMTVEDNSNDDLTGGYLIKIDRRDNNIPELGWESSFPDFKYFRYLEPQYDQITERQKDYIQNYMYNFELAMTWQNIDGHYSQYIDEKSFVDYFLVTEIGKHIDAFKLSFYMYKDKDSKGGKLNFGPLWDFNLGFGNFDFACSPDPEGWSYLFPDCGSWHPFWARKLAETPNIQHLSKCRWTELRAGPLQTDNLLLFIDEQVTKMGSAVDRNFERWPVLGQYLWPNDFVGATYEEEVNFLKTWLTERLEWMDQNMEGDCEQYVTSIKENENSKVQVYPNPSHGLLRVEWPTSEPSILSIHNLDNHLVKTQELIAPGIFDLDFNYLPNGVYSLIIRSSRDLSILHSQKLILMK